MDNENMNGCGCSDGGRMDNENKTGHNCKCSCSGGGSEGMRGKMHGHTHNAMDYGMGAESGPMSKKEMTERLEHYKKDLEEEIKFVGKRIQELSKGAGKNTKQDKKGD